MRKLWLVFAQTVTVSLGVVFVISTLRPDLLSFTGRPGSTVTVREVSRTARPAPHSDGIASFSTASRKAMASVVNIFTSSEIRAPKSPFMADPLFRRFFGDQLDGEPQRTSSLGSGVIVGAEGFIVTNHHVIESADQIEVSIADGRQLRARVVGTDPETDIAVLKVDANDLPAITFSRPDSLNVGDVVLAIGNPFGVGQTVTMGIVSALGRSHLNINTFENFIQTDAAINPGNSGGALVDAAGRLVGINTAIFSRSGGSMGIGFAIPVATARQVMDALVRDGSVSRGWIGVEPRDLTPEIAERFGLPVEAGVLIAGVLQDGPAQQGDLRPGDVVVKIGSEAVKNTAQLMAAVAALKPNSPAVLRVQRGDKALDVKLDIGQRPAPRRAER